MSSSYPYLWKNVVISGQLPQHTRSGAIYQSLTFAQHFYVLTLQDGSCFCPRLERTERPRPSSIPHSSLPSLEGQSGLTDGQEGPFVPEGQRLALDLDSRGFSNPLP